MSKLIKKSNKKIGEHPGALIHVGKKYSDKSAISMLEYSKDGYREKKVTSIEECFTPQPGNLAKYNDADKLSHSDKPSETDKFSHSIKWINIDGLSNIDVFEKLGKHFKFHPLMLEDILNTGLRAKIDDYEDYIFVALKMLYYDDKTDEIKSEQVSFVLLKDYVLTFQEFSGDTFDNVRERIRNEKGNIRKLGADYLLYALIDAIVDSYYVILEKVGDKTEDVEEQLMDNPDKKVLQGIYKLKRELLYLRNSIWPLRGVTSTLVNCQSPLIKEGTNVYLRDVYDHIIQVIDTLETYRDMLSGMLDTYLSSISNKTNDIMKVLTILSTIFIPITFVAGIYGMNFKYMPPEMGWKFGYPLFWLINIIIIIIFIIFFKKKKWL